MKFGRIVQIRIDSHIRYRYIIVRKTAHLSNGRTYTVAAG